MNLGDVLLEMVEDARNNKETASTSDEARHWAIIRTELEKVSAYYETYLKPKPTAEGGSE